MSGTFRPREWGTLSEDERWRTFYNGIADLLEEARPGVREITLGFLLEEERVHGRDFVFSSLINSLPRRLNRDQLETFIYWVHVLEGRQSA